MYERNFYTLDFVTNKVLKISETNLKAENDTLADSLIDDIFADLDFSDVGQNAPDQTSAFFEQDKSPTDSTRRGANYKAMLKRKRSLKNKNVRIFRTRSEITKKLASTEAMQLAARSARGDLEGTIVYIDLIPHLPSTSHKQTIAPIIPKKWRELSDQATACFYQLGAAAIEADANQVLVPFSFNLSECLWRAASGSKHNDVTYLQHLLKTSLSGESLFLTKDFPCSCVEIVKNTATN